MRQIADFHIHSKYSRACSGALTLENIDKTCRIKGVDIIATGDFTYPQWFSDIKNELEETSGLGLYKLKSAKDNKIKFILSTELALIYKQGDKARRIHLVVHAPNIKAAEELNDFLDKKFNIRSDGRPILGMSSPDLVKLCLAIHPKFMIYPAHIWTPWFSVFGSKSGFNSMEECFGNHAKDIYAYETGLSSDPEMNWRLSALDNLTLLSNSDAHSLPNIGREANVFELNEISYDEIYNAIKQKDTGKIKYTIEFYPEEGMYHYDGHRLCGARFSPEQTKKHKGVCPVCKKPLTIGVVNRVEELADRPANAFAASFAEVASATKAESAGKPAGLNPPTGQAKFVKLVELDKIIAEAFGVKSRNSRAVQSEYNNIIKRLGPELKILIDEPLEKIKQIALPAVAEGIRRARQGELIIEPGFDGQYGAVKIFSEKEKGKEKQRALF
ncbi:MAG: endonuclease Q family protein [bacterium]|nr:endonuclease Q family protein [bacterium]